MRRNTTLRTAVALAAVTALLGACSDNGADDDTKADPAPSSSPAAGDTSAPAEEVDLPDGVLPLPGSDPGADAVRLEAGRYRVPLDESLSFDVDVPDQTYAHDDGLFLASGPVVLKTELADETYGVPADACTEQAIVPAGPTVDDLVEAIHGQPIYAVTGAEPVELGGAHGTYLEIRIRSDYVTGQCADGVALPGTPNTSIDFAPDYHGYWWILDVDGQRVVVQQNCGCGTDRLDRAAAIPQSIAFTPTS
jgi:hypothetical protein